MIRSHRTRRVLCSMRVVQALKQIGDSDAARSQIRIGVHSDVQVIRHQKN